MLASGTEFEYPVFELALVRGWAVAVTDYEGLGTPGEHTDAVAVACSTRSGTSAPRSSPPTPATTSTSTPGSPGC